MINRELRCLTLKKEKNEFFEWVKVIVLTAVFVIGIRTFIFSPIMVDGASMMPTYEDGDRIIVNKIGKTITDLERFDIVVFKAPDERNFIKRIIGLPGDHIAYENDELYVNGEKFEEPYLSQYKSELDGFGDLTYDFTLEQLTDRSKIPEDYYLVLGDNRRKSSDSRDARVGLVAKDKIIGKANIRVYPFDEVGWVQ